MNKLKSPTDIIRLPSTLKEQNHRIETLKEKFKGVQGPSELDAATKKEGMSASLLNFHFATQVDLSSIGLGTAVYIPVQVTGRDGGRKSLYFLDQNEEVLAGIYVTCEGGIALRYVKRATGSSLPAQAGDVYHTRITSRDGEQIVESREELQEFDPQTGRGQFVPSSSNGHSNIPLTADRRSSPTPTACYFFSLFNQAN